MRLLYNLLASHGSSFLSLDLVIIAAASVACRSAAVTPLDVMGSTSDAASPANNQLGQPTADKPGSGRKSHSLFGEFAVEEVPESGEISSAVGGKHSRLSLPIHVCF